MKRALAVLGTASDVGKSLVTVALCRLLTDAGLDVAPFKAQNMANQAGVTADGLEMPRAQILQARACRKEPHVDMGPILLKPISSTGAELVVLGRALGVQNAAAYFRDTTSLAAIADGALDRLAARHDVIVLEGAGSPVEMNLADRDFTNLRAARHARAALILVADIDRGGVFAQAKGTVELLPTEDRARLLGVVVNRFRGDRTLFEDGIAMLEALTGVPVLGVVAHVDHALDEEDRPFRIPIDGRAPDGMLRVGVVLSPRVANTEDLAPLLAEPDLYLTWLTRSHLALGQHLLIVPGSKATVADLVHHTASGMAEAMRDAYQAGAYVLGLCGGYQMLGVELTDLAGTEGGPSSWPGLGLLPVRTTFEAGKRNALSEWTSAWPQSGCRLSGYEIHHGRSESAAMEGERLVNEAGSEVGWRRDRAAGTYLHGLLANDDWRSAFLNQVRRAHGFPQKRPYRTEPLDDRLDRWAQHVHRSLRPGAWERILAAVTR